MSSGTTRKTRTVFVAFLLSACCFPAFASDDGVSQRLFPTGVRFEYEFRGTVLADGSSSPSGAAGAAVGHRTVGRLSVANLLPANDGSKLLRLHVSKKKHRLRTMHLGVVDICGKTRDFLKFLFFSSRGHLIFKYTTHAP